MEPDNVGMAKALGDAHLQILAPFMEAKNQETTAPRPANLCRCQNSRQTVMQLRFPICRHDFDRILLVGPPPDLGNIL